MNYEIYVHGIKYFTEQYWLIAVVTCSTDWFVLVFKGLPDYVQHKNVLCE